MQRRISKMLSAVVHIKKWPIWSKYCKTEWTIILIGTITLFFLFINIFTSLSVHTPPPRQSSAISLADTATFENTLASLMHTTVQQGEPVTILANAEEFLPDLLTEMERATSSIYMTNYIWDDGAFSDQIFEAAITKAQEGVTVRILLDGVAGRKVEDEQIERLTSAGGSVAYFKPITLLGIYRINSRTHVRDYVIDGNVAYIGGIGISDSWFGSATSSSSWHDYMFKLRGAMAKDAHGVFSNMWSQTTGEVLTHSASTTTTNQTQQPTASNTSLSASPRHFISLFSSPSADMSSNMHHFIWLSISSATSSIRVQNPYLLPDESMRQALTSKARQGVDVEIIVPGRTNTPHTRWASQSSYTELLEAGVKIYEYEPSYMHAKIMTVDGKWSVIGSANLDNRSSRINLEYILGVTDEQLAKDIETQFEEDKTKARQITLEEWKETSIFMVPIRLISKLFIHQY